MKKILLPLIEELKGFVTGRDKAPKPQPIINPKLVDTIERALSSQAGVHIIYQESDFTGNIIKFDQDRSQLVVENFKKSITMMIHLKEIKKISILPISSEKIRMTKNA